MVFSTPQNFRRRVESIYLLHPGIASPGVWTPFAVEASMKLSDVQPVEVQSDSMQVRFDRTKTVTAIIGSTWNLRFFHSFFFLKFEKLI